MIDALTVARTPNKHVGPPPKWRAETVRSVLPQLVELVGAAVNALASARASGEQGWVVVFMADYSSVLPD